MSGSGEYYGQGRPEMLQFIPESTKTLIDIGCGEGRFGAAVKRTLPQCEVWGVEPVTAAATIAAQHSDKIVSQKIEEIGDLPSEYFDIVIMNDVLEHLTYSEPALSIVKRLLKPSGQFIMSLPNVRYYTNVRDLLFKGDWQYEDFGIRDRTHFRFFTKKSATRLLSENGFEVTKIVGLNAPRLKLHYRALFGIAPSSFSDMVFPQHAFVSRAKH
jgi:2-polyprenyl-3-methyl-5-hydroxy-6-metoxy-1,4-benzoquinol methylase